MIKAVIFDLDGTLIDTIGDLLDGANYVMNKYGYPTRSEDEIKSFVGNGIRTLITRCLPKGCSVDIIDKCTIDMIEYYSEHSLVRTAPYPKVLEMVHAIHNLGIKTAVVTNKVQDSAEFIIKKFFGDVIDIVIGDIPTRRLKPAPEGMIEAMELLNVSKNECIYVGDTEVDMLTASNAGVVAYAVLWGFRDKSTLINSGATNFITDAMQLVEIVSN